MTVFQLDLDQPVPPRPSSFTCSRGERFAISGRDTFATYAERFFTCRMCFLCQSSTEGNIGKGPRRWGSWESMFPSEPARGSKERCKFLQWGPGQGYLEHFMFTKPLLVSILLTLNLFPKNRCCLIMMLLTQASFIIIYASIQELERPI